jgi:hypothetical protein
MKRMTDAENNTSSEKIDALCNDCGEAFSAFLQQMEEHNAKVVVCPKCGKVHDYGQTAKSDETATRQAPIKH